MEILHEFKTYLQGKGLSQRTINSYINMLLQFARWTDQTYEQFDATAVTTLDVAGYR